MNVGDKVRIKHLHVDGVIAWGWMKLMGIPERVGWSPHNQYGRWEVLYGGLNGPKVSRSFHDWKLEVIE